MSKRNKGKGFIDVYFYFNKFGKKQCRLCGYYWPEQFVQLAYFEGGHVPCCAMCWDAWVPGGITAPLASRILQQQIRYYQSEKGVSEFLAQRFNYLIKTKKQKGRLTMITPLVRFSYANVFEPRQTPSGDMKYSVALLLPKEDDKGLQQLKNSIQAAIETGLEKGTFSKAHVPLLRLPIRDGDKEINDEGKPKNPGYWFFNANSSNPPGVVHQEGLRPLMTKDEFYSGCWGRADVNFFPYNQAGNRGVGCGLNHVMKCKDDDRLDGRQSVDQAFAQYAEEIDDAEAPAATDPGTNPFK